HLPHGSDTRELPGDPAGVSKHRLLLQPANVVLVLAGALAHYARAPSQQLGLTEGPAQAGSPTLGGDYPSAWTPTPSVGSTSRRPRSRQTGKPHRAEQPLAPAQSTKPCLQPAERHGAAGLSWPLRFGQAARSSLG